MKAPTALGIVLLALHGFLLGGCTGRHTPEASTTGDASPASVDLKPWPAAMEDTLSLPEVSIPQLVASAPRTGQFNIRGYVIDQRDGCYCPPGATTCSACSLFSSWITLATSPETRPAQSRFDSHPEQITLDGPVGLPYEASTEYVFSVEVNRSRERESFVRSYPNGDPEGQFSEAPDISLFFVSTLGITPVLEARR